MNDTPETTPYASLIQELERTNAKLDTATEEMHALTHRLDLIKVKAEAAEKQADSAKTYAERGRQMMAGAIGLGVVAIILAIGVWVGLNATNDSRAEARRGGCFGDNRILETVRSGIIEGVSVPLKTLAVDPNNLTPDEQLLYDNYRNAVIVAVMEQVRDRDCSKQGIEDFLQGIEPTPTTVAP